MHSRGIAAGGMAGLVLLALAGCVPGRGGSAEANKAAIRRLTDEAMNPGKPECLDELMAENVVSHGMPAGFPPGRKGFEQLMRAHHTGFPDFHCTIEDLFAEGDRVVDRWTWTGKHTGEFIGVKPTGKQGTLTGISIYRFEGGRIVEQWHETNMLGLLTQLGVLPKTQEKK